MRVCRQGMRDYGRLRIIERTDPRGYPYYWFGLAPTVETPGHVTDLEVVADGYISVTPLHLDLTHEPGLDQLAERFGGASGSKPRRRYLDALSPNFGAQRDGGGSAGDADPAPPCGNGDDCGDRAFPRAACGGKS